MKQMTSSGMTSEVPTRQLVDGNEIPLLGFGVWQVPEGEECGAAVRSALGAGYRHIDTAQAYGNEESVGRALRESGIAREQIFVTTKFYPGKKDPVAELEGSLRRLGTDYVDLYIIHWPQGGPTWAWPGMERARELGHARSIGVSNFSVSDLEQTLSVTTKSPPVINQVQFSPFEFRQGLLEGCQRLGVALESYSSLGTGRHLDDPTVVAVARNVDRTPAQVLLRWCVQRDIPVLPKSTHKERIIENGKLFDFALTDTDMSTLDDLDATGRTSAARESKWWSS
jgi:diketogulonate reductase-like aldo/keto reductase